MDLRKYSLITLLFVLMIAILWHSLPNEIVYYVIVFYLLFYGYMVFIYVPSQTKALSWQDSFQEAKLDWNQPPFYIACAHHVLYIDYPFVSCGIKCENDCTVMVAKPGQCQMYLLGDSKNIDHDKLQLHIKVSGLTLEDWNPEMEVDY